MSKEFSERARCGREYSPTEGKNVNETSEHLIRKSVDIDPAGEGALYRLNLALADAYQGRRPYAPGTDKAREWTVLIDHLEDLWTQARASADTRIDYS